MSAISVFRRLGLAAAAAYLTLAVTAFMPDMPHLPLPHLVNAVVLALIAGSIAWTWAHARFTKIGSELEEIRSRLAVLDGPTQPQLLRRAVGAATFVSSSAVPDNVLAFEAGRRAERAKFNGRPDQQPE